VFRRAVEIRVSGRVVARVEVAGKSVDYTADDEWTLQLLGSEAWNVVQRMRQSRKLEIQSRVLECAINGIVIADAEGHLEWANPAFEQITGYPLTEVIGHRLNFLRSGQHDDAFYKRLWENLSAGRSFSGEFVNRRKDGTLVNVLQTITPVLGDDGRIERYISVSEDVTIRKSADDRLIFLAEHDELTGLLNRATLIAAIDQAIAESDRIGGGFAVLYLGIDHFKTVNERLGRLAGNAVLQRIAAILGDCVRPTDSVARCGGDEFAVLQRFARGPDDAATLARRLVSALAAASDDPSDGARLGASIGISVFPADQGRAEALLMNAELAMHRAKLETRGSLRYFTLALHETAMTKARLSGALPAAIRERQIFLLYQPIVELSGGRLIGCEALARWRHPTLGMLPPAHFIAIAEETGMIRELGLHILRRAIEEFGAAMSEAAAGGMTLSVNLSFGQFSEAEFIDEVRDELASSGFPANRLELELTESMLALEPDRAIETTRALVELGCTLAIDDFGTGYSSLPQLRRYGVDSLKIDRSFITDLAEGEGPQAVVRATIAMAHSLGMAIIAEGVETQEQADFLRGEGAEYSQGYLFGRPMAIEELAALWRAGIADPALTQNRTAAPGQPRPVARAPRNTHPGSAKIH
jgi:diguanylate cyclase (GGDEF)-like protein/PAS domain S-box-containing protein